MIKLCFTDIKIVDERKAKMTSDVPDYEIHSLDMAVKKHVKITEQDARTKHPSEIMLPEQRAKLDYKNTTNTNQLMLFNFPDNTTVQQVRDLCSIRGVRILDLELVKGIDGEQVAYIKVTTESPQQVKILQDALYNQWIEDKKIKAKTRDELAYESFNNRTIIISNLPANYKSEDVLEAFKDNGCITGIELPMMDVNIHEHLKNKSDKFLVEKREFEKKEFKRAQQLVKESIETHQEYEQFLIEYFGEERAQQLISGYSQENKVNLQDQYEILHNQRKISIHNILTQLQVESNEVNQARDLLLKLKNKVDSQNVPSLESSSQQPSTVEEKKILENAIRYLNKNREEIDDTTLDMLNRSILNKADEQSDTLEQLMQLSRSELATAYDHLISSLTQRQQLIENRIKDQINYLGKDERILFEGKDFAREQEDIKNAFNPFNKKILAEEFLSVSEQVRNVLDHKNIGPEDKLTMIVKGLLDPTTKANFTKDQLAYTENEVLNDLRDYDQPNIETPPSLARMMFAGAPLKPAVQQYVDETVNILRDQFETPFDELYHKEKKLIDQVVKAELALKAKEEKLEIPFGAGRHFQPGDLPQEVLEQSVIDSEHQFVRDQRNKSKNIVALIFSIDERLLNEAIDNSQGSGKYEIQMSETNELKKFYEQGMISKKEYETYMKELKEQNLMNLGYAFLTFSHTEEAKLALLLTQNTVLDGLVIETALKGKLDHKDLDTRYQLNKLKNESQLIDEIEKLREAKQELRDFEKNIDKDLPSLKKFRNFQKMARDFVENKELNDRTRYYRTPEEEEKVNQQLRKLQRENPDIDYTQLFDTDRAEQARKTQHKKTLAAYKAFQFLKHGIDMQGKTPKQQQQKPKKNPLQTNDPYDFPPLQETVSRFLTKEKYPRVFDAGEASNKPGRKFEYTELDFLESYFGPDYSRQTPLEVQNDTAIFGFNESLKKQYKIEKYLQTPQLEAQRQKLKEFLGYDMYTGRDSDPALSHLIQNFDQAEHEQNTLVDRPHPTDPNRTLLTDAENRVNSYIARRKKHPSPSWNPRDLKMIQDNLLEEYDAAEQKMFDKEEPAESQEDTKQTEKFEPNYEGEQQNRDHRQNRQHFQGRNQDRRRNPRHTNQRSSTQNETAPGETMEEFEFETDEFVDKNQQELNKEFIYDYKHHTRNDENYEPTRDSDRRMQNFEQTAEKNNMEPEELLDSLRDVGNIPDAANFNGKFIERKNLGMLFGEKDVQNREKKRRDLNDYTKDTESEREDEDIYSHYIEQMNKAKKERAEEDKKLTKEQKLAREKLEELEKLFPETPRFEGFFKSQSQGKHPFEEDQFKFDKENEEAEQQRMADEEYDEELHQRELYARLMGEKLTPRQFATLFKIKSNQTEKIAYEMDDEREQFITARDYTKIMEEMIEAERRRKVKSGEWNEPESHQNIRNVVKELQQEFPKHEKQLKMENEFFDMYQTLFAVQSPKKIFEREYYFDEGLGETLKEHTDKIKENFPDIDVQVKRDRDGCTLIKTAYKPIYKYDLDKITNFDPESYQHKIKESMEAVMKNVLPIGNVNNDFSKLDKETLEKSMKLLLPFQSQGEERYDLDARSKDMMQKLVEERFNGKYKDDSEGFAHAFMQFSEQITYDKTKKFTQQPLGGFMDGTSVNRAELFAEFDKEKELMQTELLEQLSLRIKEHLYLKERKPTDFIKGRRSEESTFSNQVEHFERTADILQDKFDELNGQAETEQFDKDAYYRLKAEIKSRREAKERLLRQGFPELKPYITI